MGRPGVHGDEQIRDFGCVFLVQQRWLGESEQSDKWVPCLIAALLPRSRRDHVETFATQPQPYIQGEGGLGCDQG
jgi:hypothetical protein